MNNALKFKFSTADNTLAGQVRTALASLTGKATFLTIAALVLILQENYDTFMAALTDSVYGGRTAKAIKNTAKKVMVTNGNLVVDGANRIANGNRDILAETGLPLGVETNTPTILQPLKSFKLWNGPNLGEIFARAVTGGGSVGLLIEYAVGNTLEEITGWTGCPDSTFTCKVSGLTSQSRVWFRTTVIGTRGQKIMSAPISIVVL
jgi:hypothetical protein